MRHRPGAEWVPAISDWTYDRVPEVGVLIGINRKVWRVVAVTKLSPGNWTERAAELWVERGRPDDWDYAPTQVSVVPVEGGKRAGMTVQPWQYVRRWFVVPEHYAVCSKCGEPAPCTEYEGELQAVHEMEQLVERMAVPDGWCPGCSEPITSRQKSHWFSGPNLLNPLGRDGVAFHARGRCRSSAADYENQWVAADPGRVRSLLTLSCQGTVTVHADGSGECWGAAESDCPSVYAHHRARVACYFQDHGCPLGCQREGHPGIRLAKNLTPNGARL